MTATQTQTLGYSETHTLELHKYMQRRTATDISKMQDAFYSRSAAVAGWTVQVPEAYETLEAPEDIDTQWMYKLEVTVTYKHASKLPEAQDFDSVLRRIAMKASQAAQGRFTLVLVDGAEWQPREATEVTEEEEEGIGYAPCAMPDDFRKFFGHLYGLDPQLNRLEDALTLAIETGFRKRENVVLYGPPGCGKSDTALAVQDALGSEAVLSLDSTQVTEAGVIKLFAELETLPRVVIFEEIEKGDPDGLRMLLAMLDGRGEIRKVTARGAIQRETRVLAIATVNNYAKFTSMLAGALEDRFPTDVRYNAPSRDVLKRILTREVKDIGGNLAWIAPTLDYCEANGISNPRRVIGICLTGRNRLLTGEAQADMDATKPLVESA